VLTGLRTRWCLLIHQLPPKPLYLRARIRQRLARVGALALKNSVYVLPHSESSVEDFEWIAEEAVAGDLYESFRRRLPPPATADLEAVRGSKRPRTHTSQPRRRE
jgi:hypothetical protein